MAASLSLLASMTSLLPSLLLPIFAVACCPVLLIFVVLHIPLPDCVSDPPEKGYGRKHVWEILGFLTQATTAPNVEEVDNQNDTERIVFGKSLDKVEKVPITCLPAELEKKMKF